MKAALLLSVLCASCASTPHPVVPLPATAETVVVTYLPKAGQDAALQQEIAATWSEMLRLRLTANDEHHFYRAEDDNSRPYFVEIFSWKDAETPDHVPPAIEAHWKKFSDLVEPRGERPGLQIAVVKRL